MTHSISASEVLTHPLDIAIKLGTSAQYGCVAHDRDSFIRRTPKYKIVKKFLHKYLYLLVKRQLGLLREKLALDARILVLYTGKDSFGDANLELCGRALLRGKGVRLDLLTLPKLHPQFKEDDVFQNVYACIDQLDPSSYDAVLLAEFNHRSLRLKAGHFARLPFACLFGYFDGPARNQACFSHAAFNDIFSLGLNDATLLDVAKPYLHCVAETERSVESLLPAQPFLALSVGGVDPYRSYRHWAVLLHMLDAQAASLGLRHVVLIGSDNGAVTAEALLREKFEQLQLSCQVSKLSLLQTRVLIARATLFVGCDGGLMHVAHSTLTPTVALFSNKEPYEYWTTNACHCHALQSTGSASDIQPERILSALQSTVSAESHSHS